MWTNIIDITRQINWVDIFVVILLLRIGYVAFKTGLPIELFKLLGTISAVYLSLHYYTLLSDFIRQQIRIEKMSLELLDLLSFIILALVGYLGFVLLRLAFCRFIKMVAVPDLNRWGGLLLGLVRCFLLVGLIIFNFSISGIGYLKNSSSHSYLGKAFFRVAPDTYSWLWNNLTSKFMTGEKFNKTVLEVTEVPKK